MAGEYRRIGTITVQYSTMNIWVLDDQRSKDIGLPFGSSEQYCHDPGQTAIVKSPLT